MQFIGKLSRKPTSFIYPAGALSLCATAVCLDELFVYFAAFDCHLFYSSTSEPLSCGEPVMHRPKKQKKFRS
jgi:hypothetical protein